MWNTIKNMVEISSRPTRLIMFIVCVALLLNNMLYTVIVPIIPDYLESVGKWKHIIKNMSEENEDVLVGILFTSKAIVQLIVNPFSGVLIDRIGYDLPMCFGLGVIFISTMTLAFGQSYGILLVARSLQGIGSAFADTSGLAMIADRYQDKTSRSRRLGIALAFISFGLLIAPPFGGILYHFFGKRVPFITFAFIALFDGILLFITMPSARFHFANDSTPVKPKGTPIWRLLKDPYIIVCAGALSMTKVSLAFLEPTISIWMREVMNATEWQMGLLWLPGFLPYIIGIYLTVKLNQYYPKYQWLVAFVGLLLQGTMCLVIPFCGKYAILLIPISGICFGTALVDTALLPTLAYLVDVRHTSVYGSVYAIASISYSVAYIIAPIFAGSIMYTTNFLVLNILIFLSNIMYAPVLYILRHFIHSNPLEMTN